MSEMVAEVPGVPAPGPAEVPKSHPLPPSPECFVPGLPALARSSWVSDVFSGCLGLYLQVIMMGVRTQGSS